MWILRGSARFRFSPGREQAMTRKLGFALSFTIVAAALAASIVESAAEAQRRGGGGARPGGGGAATHQVRSSASTNLNRNTNVNRNVNVNRNLNVDVDVHHQYGYGPTNRYHPVARAAAVATTAAVTAAVVGSYYRSLPSNCVTVVRYDVSYYQCGSAWYQPTYVGSEVQYIVVDAP
jgi:hypothetical protein